MSKRRQWVDALPNEHRRVLDKAMHYWKLEAAHAESGGDGVLILTMRRDARLDYEELRQLFDLVHDMTLSPSGDGDPPTVTIYCKSTPDIQEARDQSTERKLSRATRDASFAPPPKEGISLKALVAINELTTTLVRTLDCRDGCKELDSGTPDARILFADVRSLVLSDLVSVMRGAGVGAARYRVWVILGSESMRILIHM